MAVITEDYVSFETAKLLKEKGFDSECHSYYFPYFCPDGSVQYDKYVRTELTKNLSYYEIYSLKNLPKDYYLAPTLQMAMKWLRVVHNIDICAFPCYYNYNSWGYDCQIFKNKDLLLSLTQFSSFEKAVEKAVEVALQYYLEK